MLTIARGHLPLLDRLQDLVDRMQNPQRCAPALDK